MTRLCLYQLGYGGMYEPPEGLEPSPCQTDRFNLTDQLQLVLRATPPKPERGFGCLLISPALSPETTLEMGRIAYHRCVG